MHQSGEALGQIALQSLNHGGEQRPQQLRRHPGQHQQAERGVAGGGQVVDEQLVNLNQAHRQQAFEQQ